MSVVKSSVLALAMLVAAPVFAGVTINIDPAKPGAVINKNVYGQFAEHLGTGIYAAMWVGPGSQFRMSGVGASRPGADSGGDGFA